MIRKTLTMVAVSALIAAAAVSSADAAQRGPVPLAMQSGYGSADGWYAANGDEAIMLQHGGRAHGANALGEHGDQNGGHGGSHGSHR